MRLGECTVLVKPNRGWRLCCVLINSQLIAETQVDIKQSVRNKDVFIIESGGKCVVIAFVSEENTCAGT